MAAGLEAYAGVREHVHARLAGVERGDPQATADAVLKVVDADEPPLRVILGNVILPAARAAYADRLATWASWEAVSNAAQGESRVEAVAPF